MLSPLRNRFGIPGVISVMALVFAMLGGAYAAQSNSGGGKATASAKAKKGPRGPKGATGPAGPAGPAGPQGPAGPKGDAGANGSNGSNGAPGATGAKGSDGKSVVTTPFSGEEELPPNEGPCTGAGGSEVEVEGSEDVEYICNGHNGSGADVLTGVWGVGGERGSKEGKAPLEAAINYGQQIEPAPKLVYVAAADGSFADEWSFGGVIVGFVIDTKTGTFVESLVPEENPAAVEEHCGSGTIANPSAEPGTLCVFVETEGLEPAGLVALINEGKPSPFWVSPDPESGAIVPFDVANPSEGYAKGSWAVNVK